MRTWHGEPLVDGTCATRDQYDYWAYGGPHSAMRYAAIQRERERLARRDALLMREWERQGAA